MRAFIDLQWMKPGYSGGIEPLARALLNTLLQIDFSNEYSILLPSETRFDFDLRHHTNVRLFSIDGPGYYSSRVVDEGARMLHIPHQPARERIIQKATRGAEVGLAVPGYIAPALRHIPTVLILPDIQHEFFPEFFSPQELARRKAFFTDSARIARHICAISDFTRRSVIERLDVPPEKISDIPLAADPIYLQLVSPDRVRQVCAKYQIPQGRYLFFPAATWAHKNHRTALVALHNLVYEQHIPLKLVFCGSPKEAQPEIERMVTELGLLENVRFLGYVPAQDMPPLYAGAACLLFPSLFEGFGMPVVEAMSVGCPVICSSTTSLPEAAGDAALLVDPLSAGQIAQAVREILASSDLREKLVEKGKAQARRFSWIHYATRIAAVMRRVANENRDEHGNLL